MENNWGASSYVDGVLRWFFVHWINQNCDTSQDEEQINGTNDLEESEDDGTTAQNVVSPERVAHEK